MSELMDNDAAIATTKDKPPMEDTKSEVIMEETSNEDGSTFPLDANNTETNNSIKSIQNLPIDVSHTKEEIQEILEKAVGEYKQTPMTIGPPEDMETSPSWRFDEKHTDFLKRGIEAIVYKSALKAAKKHYDTLVLEKYGTEDPPGENGTQKSPNKKNKKRRRRRKRNNGGDNGTINSSSAGGNHIRDRLRSPPRVMSGHSNHGPPSSFGGYYGREPPLSHHAYYAAPYTTEPSGRFYDGRRRSRSPDFARHSRSVNRFERERETRRNNDAYHQDDRRRSSRRSRSQSYGRSRSIDRNRRQRDRSRSMDRSRGSRRRSRSRSYDRDKRHRRDRSMGRSRDRSRSLTKSVHERAGNSRNERTEILERGEASDNGSRNGHSNVINSSNSGTNDKGSVDETNTSGRENTLKEEDKGDGRKRDERRSGGKRGRDRGDRDRSRRSGGRSGRRKRSRSGSRSRSRSISRDRRRRDVSSSRDRDNRRRRRPNSHSRSHDRSRDRDRRSGRGDRDTDRKKRRHRSDRKSGEKDRGRSSLETPSKSGISSPPSTPPRKTGGKSEDDTVSDASPRGVATIPPFYRPAGTISNGKKAKPIRKQSYDSDQTWEGIHTSKESLAATDPRSNADVGKSLNNAAPSAPPRPIKEQVADIFNELGKPTTDGSTAFLTMDNFVKITKEICSFPTFFNGPLYKRILYLWNTHVIKSQAQRLIIWNEFQKEDIKVGLDPDAEDGEKDELLEHLDTVITKEIFKWYWVEEMEDFDASERFFRLLKKPFENFIGKDDFLPYMKELLRDHPGLEFLSNHAEFQDKYAITVVTRIFFTVNRCHSGRITTRQIRRSDLLSAFHQVDEEEDINKVTRYFSYEHFYVLYCRFWELDHDRDYKITREDLMKYGEQCLSHMIVDRIFEAAPRPFGLPELEESKDGSDNNSEKLPKDYLSYEDFIFFMLSEEDKANEISVRYWFTCIDVDGDGMLNNMEMRSFYALQQHRMTQLGHEYIPFEDMLCQMIDMIKPKHEDYLVVEDFLQEECATVSGALFDALFNLNKYMQFEQRDPFQERQKREDEFETDWDRFACMDYNRLAMEEEAREEDAMEIDWVTVDDEEEDGEDFNLGLGGSSEAPF